jgi:hypothetical protein
MVTAAVCLGLAAGLVALAAAATWLRTAGQGTGHMPAGVVLIVAGLLGINALLLWSAHGFLTATGPARTFVGQGMDGGPYPARITHPHSYGWVVLTCVVTMDALMVGAPFVVAVLTKRRRPGHGDPEQPTGLDHEAGVLQ